MKPHSKSRPHLALVLVGSHVLHAGLVPRRPQLLAARRMAKRAIRRRPGLMAAAREGSRACRPSQGSQLRRMSLAVPAAHSKAGVQGALNVTSLLAGPCPTALASHALLVHAPHRLAHQRLLIHNVIQGCGAVESGGTSNGDGHQGTRAQLAAAGSTNACMHQRPTKPQPAGPAGTHHASGPPGSRPQARFARHAPVQGGTQP